MDNAASILTPHPTRPSHIVTEAFPGPGVLPDLEGTGRMSFSQLLSQVTTNLATSTKASVAHTVLEARSLEIRCRPVEALLEAPGEKASPGLDPRPAASCVPQLVAPPPPSSASLLTSPHSDSAECTRGWEPVSVHECVSAHVRVHVRVHLHTHALPPCELKRAPRAPTL